jgi:GTPase SAR1 family protein
LCERKTAFFKPIFYFIFVDLTIFSNLMKRRDRHPAPQKAVRIVVLGDPGAGKSSIITVFISGHFEENLSPLIPVAVISR